MSEMRDHCEITVAGEARSARPAKAARHPTPPRAAITDADASEWRVMLGAVASGTLRMCRRNPGTLFGGVVALGAVVMVSMNALGHQTGRHPAPILPKIAIRQDALRQDALRQDAVRKDPVPKASPDMAAEAARPAEPSRPPAKTAESAKPANRDAIADLIRSGETTASVTPKAAAAAPKPQPSVMQAQKALTKLGYGPLKADGLMGATTRAAIEKFERDRKLPVKGEPAGRTLRELAARAALPPA
ncbi:peptidoglycan-binding domain-containing protein [Methylobacterium sp. WL8]|uniref:peptidoglycan-binding domain-containing protein n=1 Tax=Methylobacterium sp. WL8 TaxID=2603899 RepID=UPI0032B2A523